jgi:hypothetical protein
MKGITVDILELNDSGIINKGEKILQPVDKRACDCEFIIDIES